MRVWLRHHHSLCCKGLRLERLYSSGVGFSARILGMDPLHRTAVDEHQF